MQHSTIRQIANFVCTVQVLPHRLRRLPDLRQAPQVPQPPAVEVHRFWLVTGCKPSCQCSAVPTHQSTPQRTCTCGTGSVAAAFMLTSFKSYLQAVCQHYACVQNSDCYPNAAAASSAASGSSGGNGSGGGGGGSNGGGGGNFGSSSGSAASGGGSSGGRRLQRLLHA